MSACPHGEPHPSACLECVDGEPAPLPKLVAVRAMEARFPGECARNAEHKIEVDQVIYLVTGLGWCCGRCARPAERDSRQRAVWHATGWLHRNVQVIEHRTKIQLWCKTCGAVAHLPSGVKRPNVVSAINQHINRHEGQKTA